MLGIDKSFAGVEANRSVDLRIEKGDILGLLGENGAGKTTLMNILYGLYRPDGGRILKNGKPLRLRSPRDSMRAGIGMIHQHFMLVQKHTVLENIALGYEEAPFFFPQKAVRRKIREFSREFGLEVDPDKKVWELSAGEQQRVEILKALLRRADLLIMDEPTSVLTPREAEDLFTVLRGMSRRGHAVILISHKLEEIFRICNRVQVMRKGRVSGRAAIDELTPVDLARMMVGREVASSYPKKAAPPGEVVLETEDLTVRCDQGLPAVRGLGFRVRRGEILGVAGVSGNGQREMVEALTGLRRADRGRVRLLGEEIANRSARDIHNRGVSHVPEERIKFATVANLPLFENVLLKRHHQPPFCRRKLLDYPLIRRHTESLLREYGVAAASIRTPVKNLSGGNMQKLVLGREISAKPELLIASHPTYGLDVGAAESVRKELIRCRDEGGAVLLVSEDLEELFQVCDRIAVMFEGRFAGIVDPADCSMETIGLMMAGSADDETGGGS